MRCLSCGTENPNHVTFCLQCALPFGNPCVGCGAANLARARFCAHCGLRLGGQPSEQATDITGTVESGRKASPTDREAERRHVTVLFCDLVGSTALSERLDPEDFRRVVLQFQQVCSEAVSRYEGHIGQYLGDGVLVFFGYPLAHEDDVQRAVRTGLVILSELKQLSHSLQQEDGADLSARIGIHTGQVVVGEVGGGLWREHSAVGETPNLAARVQSLAEPNTLLITGATHRLVGPHFTCQDLGMHSLKGLARPVQLFRVLGESGIETRMQAARIAGITALVGREREMGLLTECWQRVQAGKGQLVLLSGEPGIGKSRLVEELKARLTGELSSVLESYCLAYQRSTAFAPLAHLLERTCGLTKGDSPQEKLAKLRTSLERVGLDGKEAVPLLAPLVTLAPEAGYTPLVLDPLRQRQLTLTTLTEWLTGMTKQGPVLVIVEDLHWADPSSLEWLGLVVSQLSTCRLMLLLTFRPDFRPPWPASDDAHSVVLTRLAQEQTAALATRVAHNRSLPDEVLREVVKRTDGVPLFVEEMTKMLLESGLLTLVNGSYELTGPLPAQAIPTTVQDSLMARLDRLGQAKTVAQIGATIGREFRHEVLRAVAGMDEAQLERDLSRIIEADLITRDGLPPQATYLFNHALIQDSAYQSLLKTTREQFHQRIAGVLVERFPEVAETQPEVLAQHFTAAGFARQAVGYWEKAGQRAAERAAHAEAIRHIRAGIELCPRIREDTARNSLEVRLQVLLGLSITASSGYAVPQVGEAYQRARELCDLLGNTADQYPVLRNLCTFYIVRDELNSAKEYAERCLRLGLETDRADYVIEGYNILGYALSYMGELKKGTEFLEKAVEEYHSRKGKRLTYGTAQDPAVASFCLLALNRWMLGDSTQAAQYKQKALELAEDLKQPFVLAYAHCYVAMYHNLLCEFSSAAHHAGVTLEISQRHGFLAWLSWGSLQLAIASGRMGGGGEAIAQLTQTLAMQEMAGAEIAMSYFLGGLAEVYRVAGRVEEALNIVEKAIHHADRHGERWYESALYRMRGELRALKEPGAPQAAEADFSRAIKMAQDQGAKLLELQGALRLYALCLDHGRPEPTPGTLQKACNSFAPDALDIPELQEARALLSRSHAAT